MTLLQAHSHGNEWIIQFLDEVLLHGFLDTLKLIPFLFLTYLLMEFIEHKESDKTLLFIRKSGPFGPLAASLTGAIPQCGFSAAVANLYAGRVVSVGTLLAVFLSTSDEMLPILISGGFSIPDVLIIIAYKVTVALAVGFLVDIVFRFLTKRRTEININEICDADNCHCERGILHSAIHHTLTTGLFLFLATCLINSAIFFIGEENLALIMRGKPYISHLIAALFGLIPNCAASVALATFASEKIISIGTMLAGLFSGSGVGILLLFKMNKNQKENLLIALTLVLVGFAFGVLADFIPFFANLSL